MAQKQWAMGMWKANMNDAEKKAYETAKAASLQKAVAEVKAGHAKAGIRVLVGDHTITLRPTNVTDKGGVTYGTPPATVQIDGDLYRINKMSFTKLSTKGSGGVDWDSLTEPTE